MPGNDLPGRGQAAVLPPPLFHFLSGAHRARVRKPGGFCLKRPNHDRDLAIRPRHPDHAIVERAAFESLRKNFGAIGTDAHDSLSTNLFLGRAGIGDETHSGSKWRMKRRRLGLRGSEHSLADQESHGKQEERKESKKIFAVHSKPLASAKIVDKCATEQRARSSISEWAASRTG